MGGNSSSIIEEEFPPIVFPIIIYSDRWRYKHLHLILKQRQRGHYMRICTEKSHVRFSVHGKMTHIPVWYATSARSLWFSIDDTARRIIP